MALGFLVVTLWFLGEALLSRYWVTSTYTLRFRLKPAHIGEKHGSQHTTCFSWLYFSLPRRAEDISSLAIKASYFSYVCFFYISKWNIFERYKQSKNNSLYFCGHNYYYTVNEKSKGICQDRLKKDYILIKKIRIIILTFNSPSTFLDQGFVISLVPFSFRVI